MSLTIIYQPYRISSRLKYWPAQQQFLYHLCLHPIMLVSKRFPGTSHRPKLPFSCEQYITVMPRGCMFSRIPYAYTLIRSYFRYNPINKESFDSEIYSQIYDQSAGPIPDDPLTSHRLSVMFMVLAIGSLMNISLPSYSLEAEKYHQLARAALFHYPIFDEPTITAVQALVCYIALTPFHILNVHL